MSTDSTDTTAPRDVRRAYRAEHVVEHLVGRIEDAARAAHPGPGHVVVLLWHEPAEQRWIATAHLDSGAALATAYGATEIEAGRALLEALREVPDPASSSPRGADA